MIKNYILFNPLSCNGKGEDSARRIQALIKDQELVFTDVTAISDMKKFTDEIGGEDKITICGGDGTLNYFINHVDAETIKNDIFYFPCGTGNDFFHDVNENDTENVVQINDYVKNLPVVTVKGKEYKFLNNVGFGIDGYCCQVGDEMRAAQKENINYTAIAIKGLLGGFKPVTATVTVDGNTEKVTNTWLVPTMKGRFYGGGMMPTPKQNRLSEDGKVSVMIFHGWGKLKTLTIFPSIFQGEHINHVKRVKILEGFDVKVSFDRPCALQIDGETILDVTEYEVHAGEAK